MFRGWDGLFYQPTVLSDVTTTMPAYAEEILGPVAPVLRFSTVEEAIALAKENDYGHSLGILGDVGLAMTAADTFRAASPTSTSRRFRMRRTIPSAA